MERDLADLQPYIPLETTLTERPLIGKDLTVFQIFIWAWSNVAFAPGCWESYGHPIWEMHCYPKENEGEFAAPITPGDWVIPAMLYNVTDETRASLPPAPIGFADFDLLGKPYELFAQTFPAFRKDPLGGIGMTAIVDHEAGHHVGLSHEHDGWDGEIGAEIGAFFAKYVFGFDECHCTMGYVHEAAGFGQFERDNIDRNLAARAYAETLRLLSGEERRGFGVEPQLRQALASFQQMDWRSSVRHALHAYNKAARRADRRSTEDLQAASAGPYRRPHPGVVDPPSPIPDDNPEVRQLRMAQRARPSALDASERWHAPAILARASTDPNVKAYLQGIAGR